MPKVDPEALMREADELAKQAGMIPDSQGDTPERPENEPPANPQADTGEPGGDNVADQNDRGDQEGQGEEQFVPIERYKNAQAAMTKAQQEAAMLRQQNADLRALNEELRAGRQQDSGVDNASDAEAEISKLMEEYPEIAGPILTKLKKLEATVEDSQKRVRDQQVSDATTAHLNAIKAKHSDLDAIAADPDFTGWVARQTPTWQRVAEAGTAEEVIELLDRYKADMGLNETPQRESAIDRARKVAEPTLPKNRKPDPNANKRMWTRKEIAQMSLADYEKHRDEIDRAYLEGRVR